MAKHDETEDFIIGHKGEQVKLSRISNKERGEIIKGLVQEKQIIQMSVRTLIQYAGLISPQQVPKEEKKKPKE